MPRNVRSSKTEESSKVNYQFGGLHVHEIYKITRMRYGYDIVHCRCSMGGNEDESADMKCAFNWLGEYIGDPRTAQRLVQLYGIMPIRRNPTSNVCSIGFSAKHNKWYGWSHRAISGFEGKNAKQEAIRFAESVS